MVGFYAVYKMMYMFLTPLLWAMLIGTILFPLKKRFNSAVHGILLINLIICKSRRFQLCLY